MLGSGVVLADETVVMRPAEIETSSETNAATILPVTWCDSPTKLDETLFAISGANAASVRCAPQISSPLS